jgi:DNA-binding ferritin-like protein
METVKRPERSLAGTSGSGMSHLIAVLLHAATKTHMAHLKTSSYAAHMALGGFYEALPGLVDAVAEQYQGVTEKLLDYPVVSVDPINTPEGAIEHLRSLHKMVGEVQATCPYSEIVNELDVIKSCIDSAKYKLIFLH